MTEKRATPREVLPVVELVLTIPAGQALSDNSVALAGQVIALIAPSEWNPAPLTFMLSTDNVTFHYVSHWSTTEIFSMPVVPNYWVPLDTNVFAPNATIFLKIHSGHPFRPVMQTAERSFTLVMGG